MPQQYEDQGNAMNQGYQNSGMADVFSGIVNQLNTTLGSIESQMKNMVSATEKQNKSIDQLLRSSKDQSKDFDRFARSNDDFLRNFTRSQRQQNSKTNTDKIKDLANILAEKIDKSNASIIKNMAQTGKKGSIESASSSDFIRVQTQYSKEIKNLLSELQKTTYEQQKRASEIKKEEAFVNREYAEIVNKISKGNFTKSDIDRYNELYTKKASYPDQIKEVETAISKILDDIKQRFEDISEDTSKQADKLRETYEFLEEVQRGTREGLSDLAQLSPSFARKLQKQEKEKESDQYSEAIQKAENVLNESIKRLTEKLEETSGEDQELIKKQIKKLEEQKKYLKNISPLRDTWATFAKGLGTTALSMASKSIEGLISGFGNRYLDSYTEAFQRVYDSIEKTRNDISARLKMDQGGFDDLQNEIQKEIEVLGLQGSISPVDVNEAIVALASAGITDKEMLREIAIQSAKLQASGSAINLQNEGTLTNLVAQITENQRVGMSKDEAISTALGTFNTLDATIQALQEQYGNSIAFVNGGVDTLINTITTMDQSLGKSNDEIRKDLQDAFAMSASLQQYGISPDLITQTVKDLANADVSNLSSPMQKWLFQQGINPEGMKGLSYGEIQERVLDSFTTAIGSANDFELTTLANAWGIQGNPEDLRKLIHHNGEIQTKLTEDQTEKTEYWLSKIDQDLMEGKYLSKTEQVNTAAENTMTDLAQNAQHLYEGDQLFQSQMSALKTGVEEIVKLLEVAIFASGKQLLFGGGKVAGVPGAEGEVGGASGTGYSLLKSPVGTPTGTVLGDFATGADTKAGFAGKAFGVGVGAFEIGHSAISNIQKDEQGNVLGFQTAAEIIEDDETWKGIGMTVGSIAGGPIAGYIVGELMSWGAKFGKKWGESWKTQAEIEAEAEAETIKKYQDAADDQLQAASAALDAAKQQKEAAQMMSDSQKRSELIKTYGLNYSDVKGMSSEELSNKLDELTSAKEAEAEAEVVSASMVGKYSEAAGRVEYLETPVTTYDRRTSQYTEAPKIGAVSYIDWSGEGSKRKEGFASLQGEKALIDVLGNDEKGNSLLYQMSSDIEDIQRINPEKSTQDILKEWFPDADESVISNIDYFVTTIMPQRKKKYDVANETFHNRWKEASKLAKTQDPEDIYWAYVNELDHLKYPNASKLSRSVVEDPANWNKELNMPNLDTGGGSYNEMAYVDKFKSGLANVPYDGYPAVLHTGERVLTKREAEVYNSIVPDIVEAATSEQYYNSDNSTANTMNNIYSNGEIKDAVSNQTNSLTAILSKILLTLQNMNRSAYIRATSPSINYNSTHMNSDVTQLTTSNF